MSFGFNINSIFNKVNEAISENKKEKTPEKSFDFSIFENFMIKNTPDNEDISNYFAENSVSIFSNNNIEDGFVDFDNDGKMDANIIYLRDENNSIIGANISSKDGETFADVAFNFDENLLSEISIDNDSDDKYDYKHSFKYDADSQKIEREIINDIGKNSNIIINFDENGNKTNSSKTTFSENGDQRHVVTNYNETGQILNETTKKYDYKGIQKSSTTLKNTYDEMGNKTSSNKITYDNNGTISTSTITQFDENENKASVSKTEYNADGTQTSSKTTNYDENENKTSVTQTRYDSDGIQTNSKITYYDVNGNKTNSVQSQMNENGRKTYINTYYDKNEKIEKKEVKEYNLYGQLTKEIDTFNVDGKHYTYEKDLKQKNGKIDFTSQGGIGDCWLLAAVNSLNMQNPSIMNDMISYTDDGAIIKFAFGEYKITDEELQEKKFEKQYSNGGDDDMIRIEIAMEKMLTDYINGEISLPELDEKRPTSRITYKHNNQEDGELYIDGGWEAQAFYFMTGKKVNVVKNTGSDIMNKSLVSFSDKLLDEKEVAATVSFIEDYDCKDIYGNSITLHDNHAYTIKGITDEYVAIVNPWDSSKEERIPIDIFNENFRDITYCDLR